MNTNIVIKWLQETIQRLFTSSPLFFKIWTIISTILVLITGVPELVNFISGVITIPDLWNANITLAVAWAARAALFMSLLTTQSTPVLVTSEGTILKTTDDVKLPFTAIAEQKIAVATDVVK